LKTAKAARGQFTNQNRSNMALTKKLLSSSLLVLLFLALMFTANAQNRNYIANHKAIATVLSKRYGIPAPVILAIAAVESSGGKCPVAKVLNNHFGMEGKNSFVNRKGHKSRYKQYANVFASYLDFCNVISRKHFYKRLKNNENSTVWVMAISHAGYSELPEEWEKKVLGVLHSIQPKTVKMHTSPALASVK
jgi:Bax protein